tara:strand:- start:2 stop:337 length:336 start_codon:yes stop_codon:yes gene_type:complete
MQLISRLSGSPEARREIGRLQGFSRLMRLARLAKDDALSREVLRTARSLLRASQEQQLQDLAGAARRGYNSGAVPCLAAPAGARRVSSIISNPHPDPDPNPNPTLTLNPKP